jgi:Flp pilus assembly protein TadD
LIDLRRVRPLDAAIALVLVIVVGLGVYLGYSVWWNQRQLKAASPIARGLDELVVAVRQNPDDLGLRIRLAGALRLAGRRNEAVKQYEAVLRVKEDHAGALAGLGTVALSDGDFKTAESYYRKVIEITTKDSQGVSASAMGQAYFYLGTAVMEQKRFEEAASLFKEALNYRRDSSTTHYFLAVCLKEMDLDAAYRDSLGNALMFDPKHPEANYDMGILLLADGDVATAAEHFRTSADAAPDAPLPQKALDELGSFDQRFSEARRLAKADRGQAILEARVAVALAPRSIEALVLLGDLYADAKDDEKARDAYRRALSLDARNDAAKAGLERVGDGS